MSDSKPLDLSINNRKYQYYDIGQGDRTVVFLHGLGNSKEFGLDLSSRIGLDFRTISLDLPGHSNLDDSWCVNLQDYSTYVDNFVQELGLKNVYFIGFSFGGLVGLDLMSKLSIEELKNYKSTIIWASPITGVNPKVKAIKQVIRMLSALREKVSDKTVKRVTDMFNVPLSEKEVRAFSQVRLNSLVKMINLIENYKFNVNPNIKYSFIYGENDMLINNNCLSTTTSLDISNLESKFIPGAQHFGTEEGWGEAYAYIRNYLLNS